MCRLTAGILIRAAEIGLNASANFPLSAPQAETRKVSLTIVKVVVVVSSVCRLTQYST